VIFHKSFNDIKCIIGDFRLEYEIESENGFSILVFRLHIITTRTHSTRVLPSLPKTNMNSEGSGNVTGFKFKNRTRAQSRTRSPI